MNMNTSLLWSSVKDNFNGIVNTFIDPTSISEVDNTVKNFITDQATSVLNKHSKHFFDRKFIVLVLALIPILFYMSKQSSRKRKKKSEDDCLPSGYNEDSETRDNIFDVAKTGYEEGHTEYVIEMIESTGYDVNYIPPLEELSLFLCGCLSGSENLIKYLLQKGGDVLSRTNDGDSPLYLATFGVLNSESPNLNVIKYLLIAGCDVNQQNNKGFTPLHRAASKGNVDMVKFLLKYGADPNICNKAGIYPLDSAINAGNLEAAELLHIDVDNTHGWDEPHTPTHITLGLQSPQRKLLMESSRRQSHVLDH